MQKTFDESSPKVPMLFVLFPGVDPTPDVEKIGLKYGKEIATNTLINISMGQGQEESSIKSLYECAKAGNWIMLQNVHLMQNWLRSFERNLEIATEDVHESFRCIISSEPPPLPEQDLIPESILQNALKVANEAP
jgi:dynein heavy chain